MNSEHPLGLAVNDGLDEIGLVLEVVVQLRLRRARRFAHLVEVQTGDTAFEHEVAGCVDDAIAGRAALHVVGAAVMSPPLCHFWT